MPRVVVNDEKLTAIADEIREKTGETSPLTLDDMTDNIPKVYESGKNDVRTNVEETNQKLESVLYGTSEGGKSWYDAFWDGVLDCGNRSRFHYGFAYWNLEYIRPNRKIIATDKNSLEQTFANNTGLKKVEAAYFDFSQKPRGTSVQNSACYTFQGCTSLEVVEDIGIQAEYQYEYTWWKCSNLHTIVIVRSDEKTVWHNAFLGCGRLSHLIVEGVIGTNGFNVQGSPLLNKESLMSIINALSPTTTGLTVTLSKTAVTNAFGGVDSTEWKTLIATKPNWTISLV